MTSKPRHNPHFFVREPDGTVRLRLRLSSEEASLIEEAAGDVPLMVYIHQTLSNTARRSVKNARQKRTLPGPEDADGYET